MFASSCQRDEGGLSPEMRKVTVKAKIADTKVALSGAQVMWEDGDKLSLVFPHASEKSAHVCELSATIEDKAQASTAKFRGSLDKNVTTANGYAENGYAVYPNTAVMPDGTVAFNLPAVQTAAETDANNFAGFQSGLNLTSGTVSLEKIAKKGETDAYFKNACAILRFTLAEGVTSVTLTGTSNLAGQAPLELDEDGRLVIGKEGEWTEPSKSVTIKPSNGNSFENGTAYNLLVWPGSHTSLTLTVMYEGYGEVSKTTELDATFAASKFYTLDFDASSQTLVKELEGALDKTLGGLTEFEGSLGSVEADVDALLAQVQSVSLMTEYLDNAAYAHYSMFGNRPEKIDVSLDYIIKPESAAYALVEAFEADNSILSGVVRYATESAFGDVAVKNVVVNEAAFGKYVTVSFDASNIDDKFYTESRATSLALVIASDKTDLMSDFANLTPREGSTIKADYYEDIQVVPGARVVIPFSYAVSDPNATYEVKVSSFEGAAIKNAYMNKYYPDFKTGNFSVVVSDDLSQIGSAKVTLSLIIGSAESQEVITKDFTFMDCGERFTFDSYEKVDCIGGDVVVKPNVTENVTSPIVVSCTLVSNVGNIFTFDTNTGVERTATVDYKFNVNKVPFDYYKSVTLTQKAAGSPIDETQYYQNGERVILNAADASGCSNYLNIVILGDGYVKADLKKGDGLFERRARSAMDSFFAIEPYKTFKNRFNVYMMAYESSESGTDIKSEGINKNTYFGSYCQGGGNTAAYVADTAPVINAVKAAVGGGEDAYLRSIAILLINTSEQAGSTGYPVRESKPGFVNGYASFAIAVLAANSTGTNGLVKHEAGGHAFGRLADEYYTNGTVASDANKTDLSNWHAKGWYWNVNPNNTSNYYKFTNSAYTTDEVQYWEGGWGYNYGIYRPTTSGMMQGSTGVFNAPCRHAIYHRIITESEGANAYSWSKFLEYDQKNR